MRALALGLLMAASLTACGVQTIDQTYNDRLVQEIGVGSEAIGKVVPTLEAQVANSPVSFADPRNDRTMMLIFEGRLNKLKERDLLRLERTNDGAEKRFERVVRKLDDLALNVQAASVDISAHDDLSDGGHRFLRAWNAYLAANADRIRDMRRMFTSMRPLFGDFKELVRAVYRTAELQSLDEYDRVRRRVFGRAMRMATRSQADLESLGVEGPADRRLAALIDDSQEAQAIVVEVNERHPSGYLAEAYEG